MLKLGHLINGRSANVGNGALTTGTEGVLGEDLGTPITWQREAWDDFSFGLRPFDQSFVDWANSQDGLIVGGAVALNGRRHYAHAGMRFDLPHELWSKFRKPVVFYGLSYRVWPGQTYEHADKLRDAFSAILSNDKMILALRNDGTREWLARDLGIDDPRICEVPDPGMFTEAEQQGPYPEFKADRPNILVALNDEDRADRFGTPERREQVMRNIARALCKIVEQRHANIILVPHYFDDYRAIADVIDFSTPHLAHQNMTGVGLARVEGTKRFYGRYLMADAVMSMRVHSISPCIGLGAPMIPVSTQDRITDYLGKLHLDDLVLDAFSPDLDEKLAAALAWALDNKAQLSARYRAAREAMRAQSRAFNMKVKERLGV